MPPSLTHFCDRDMEGSDVGASAVAGFAYIAYRPSGRSYIAAKTTQYRSEAKPGEARS